MEVPLCICYVICCFVSPLQVPEPPSPNGESEDLGVLEYLENFSIVNTGTPSASPIGESEDLDVLGYLENFTIASTRIPLPLLGKVKIWMFLEI